VSGSAHRGRYHAASSRSYGGPRASSASRSCADVSVNGSRDGSVHRTELSLQLLEALAGNCVHCVQTFMIPRGWIDPGDPTFPERAEFVQEASGSGAMFALGNMGLNSEALPVVRHRPWLGKYQKDSSCLIARVSASRSYNAVSGFWKSFYWSVVTLISDEQLNTGHLLPRYIISLVHSVLHPRSITPEM